MLETKIVYLKRHAKSLSNYARNNGFVLPEYQDQLKRYTETSVPLEKEGRRMAYLAGIRLCREVGQCPAFDMALHTGCERTYDTLYTAISGARDYHYELVGSDISKTVLRMELLRERHRGHGFHMTKREYLDKYSHKDAEYKKDKFNCVPPGGESRAFLMENWEKFKKILFEDPLLKDAEKILAVTHAGPMIVAEKDALSIPLCKAKDIQKPDNCEVYRLKISYNGGLPFIACFEKLGVMV